MEDVTMRAWPDTRDNALAILHKRPDGGGETTRDNVGSSFHNGCRNRATDVMGRSPQLEWPLEQERQNQSEVTETPAKDDNPSTSNCVKTKKM